MKTVFVTIPMKEEIEVLHYPVDGNREIEYAGDVAFPVNGVLARILKKDERVKVVRIMNVEEGGEESENSERSRQNAQKFQKELEKINAEIGAKIEYEDITEPFVEDKRTYERRFKKLLATFDDGMEIVADITYGQKSLPLVLFSALRFAEKFFGAEILHIVYGQASFGKDGKIIKDSQKICDFSPLYYLNSLTAAMEAPDGKTAVKMIHSFFEL